MLSENEDERLEAFERELERAGYTVVSVEPTFRKTITERVRGEDDGSIGFVIVNTLVEIRGEPFDSELVLTVYEDRLVNHGVDIYSDPDDPLPPEKRKLLTGIVQPQKITDDDGNRQSLWTYYPPPTNLPDDLVDDSQDNIDELIEEFESVYQRAV